MRILSALMLSIILIVCWLESERTEIWRYFCQQGGIYYINGNPEKAENAYNLAALSESDRYEHYGALYAILSAENDEAGMEKLKKKTGYKINLEHYGKIYSDLFAAGGAYAEHDNDNYWHFYTEDGRILFTGMYDHAGKKVNHTDYVYYDDGSLKSKSYYNNNESKPATVNEYTYHDDGRLKTETSTVYADKTTQTVMDYTYVNDVQLGKGEVYEDDILTARLHYKDSVLVGKEEFSYRKSYYLDEKIFENIRYYVYDSLVKEERFHFANGRLVTVAYYSDENMYLEEHYEKSGDGVYLSSRYQYDTDGRQTERTVFNRDGTQRFREKSLYDVPVETGKAKIEEFYNSQDLLTDRTISFYDKNGKYSGFEQESYKDGSLLYAIKREKDLSRKITALPSVVENNPRPLTETEIDSVNRQLKLGKYEGEHFWDRFRTTEAFLTLGTVLEQYATDYCDKGVLTYRNSDEIARLKEEGVSLDWDKVELSSGKYYRISYEIADRLAKEVLGMPMEETGATDYSFYSEMNRCFYVTASTYSKDYADFECYAGSISDNWLKLYDISKTWIIKIQDGKYYPYAYIHENHNELKPLQSRQVSPSPQPRQQEEEKKEYRLKNVFLSPVRGKSEGYNNAMIAYNETLKEYAEKMGYYEEGQKFDEEYSWYKGYSLYEMTGDNIPELIIRESPVFVDYMIYTYYNSKAVFIDCLGSYGGDGGCYILENGMGYGQMNKIDRQWQDYYTYHSDGTVTKVTFGTEWDYFNEENRYYFNDEYLSREEYACKIRPYTGKDYKFARLDDWSMFEAVQ